MMVIKTPMYPVNLIGIREKEVKIVIPYLNNLKSPNLDFPNLDLSKFRY